MRKKTPLELYIFWKEISRGIQICYGIKGRMTGWRNMDLENFQFFGPSKLRYNWLQNLYTSPYFLCHIWIPHEIFFQKMYTFDMVGQAFSSSRGGKFSESGDVTLRVASSKHMASTTVCIHIDTVPIHPSAGVNTDSHILKNIMIHFRIYRPQRRFLRKIEQSCLRLRELLWQPAAGREKEKEKKMAHQSFHHEATLHNRIQTFKTSYRKCCCWLIKK